jgi:DNA-directed RNA polymerase subunit RPC12/RpoP
MHHADANCDCGAAVSALALRWRCPECGKTAIMKVSTLAAVCDGDTMRKVEPNAVSHQSAPRS